MPDLLILFSLLMLSIIPERWLPATIGILDEPFTEENGMINSTLKMVRAKVVEHYRDTIDFLYSPEGKNIDNIKNHDALSRLLKNKTWLYAWSL